MPTVTIQLSPANCQAAIRELDDYRKRIRPRLNELCRRLAEIGCQAANDRYAEASADAATTGNTGTTAYVAPLESGNGYKIVASGKDIYFIEFGTGNSAGMFYGDGLPNTRIPVYPGSYSERNAGQYVTWGYWFYGGQIMSSTPVYMPMYWAGRAIRENENRIAREVFGR